jgi:hypothetical protein
MLISIDTNWHEGLTQWANSRCTFCRKGRTNNWFILGADSEICLIGDDNPTAGQLGYILYYLREAIALEDCEWTLSSKGSANIWNNSKSATANILGDPHLSLLLAWCKFSSR